MDFNSSIKRICVFGDSIAWGACDYEKGGWVERLKMGLLENTDIDVYNMGVSGDSTIELLKRFKTELELMKPEVVVVAIGINDTKYMDETKTCKVNLEDFRKNIFTLIEIAKEFNDKMIFIGLTSVDETKTMPRIHEGKTKFYENELIKKYDSVLSEVCDTNGIKFVSVFNQLKISDLEDGLHPNSQGHQIILSKVRMEIEAFLKN